MATPDFLSPGLDTLDQLLASCLSVFMSTSCPTVAKLLQFDFHNPGDTVVVLSTATGVLPLRSWSPHFQLLSSKFSPCTKVLSSLRCSSKQGHFCKVFSHPLWPREPQTPHAGIGPSEPGPNQYPSCAPASCLTLHTALLLLPGNA